MRTEGAPILIHLNSLIENIILTSDSTIKSISFKYILFSTNLDTLLKKFRVSINYGKAGGILYNDIPLLEEKNYDEIVELALYLKQRDLTIC